MPTWLAVLAHFCGIALVATLVRVLELPTVGAAFAGFLVFVWLIYIVAFVGKRLTQHQNQSR